jgi:hypothetical protein
LKLKTKASKGGTKPSEDKYWQLLIKSFFIIYPTKINSKAGIARRNEVLVRI